LGWWGAAINPIRSLELKTGKVVSAWLHFPTAEILKSAGNGRFAYVTFSGGFLIAQNMGSLYGFLM
jgi:hypothetical protein